MLLELLNPTNQCIEPPSYLEINESQRESIWRILTPRYTIVRVFVVSAIMYMVDIHPVPFDSVCCFTDVSALQSVGSVSTALCLLHRPYQVCPSSWRLSLKSFGLNLSQNKTILYLKLFPGDMSEEFENSRIYGRHKSFFHPQHFYIGDIAAKTSSPTFLVQRFYDGILICSSRSVQKNQKNIPWYF